VEEASDLQPSAYEAQARIEPFQAVATVFPGERNPKQAMPGMRRNSRGRRSDARGRRRDARGRKRDARGSGTDAGGSRTDARGSNFRP